MAPRDDGDIEFLPTTAYAVLGLLSFGQDLCGYEIRQWAMTSLRYFYWTPAQSQIYRELRRLTEHGFVSGAKVEQDDRPDKTAYSITDAGRAELRRWVEQAPVEPIAYKHPVALRVFFGHLASTDRLRQLLLEHRSQVDAALAELETTAAALDGEAGAVFARHVALWGREVHAGDLVGTDRLLRALDP